MASGLRKSLLFCALLTVTTNQWISARRLPLLPFPVPLTESDVAKLKSISEHENAEEFSGQFEGDMVLSEQQISDLVGRNGIAGEKYTWPNRTIIYELSEAIDEERAKYIRSALDDIEAATCLKFVARTNEEKYIQVTDDETGCHSEVGFQDHVQVLNLQGHDIGKGCMRKGTIVHEFIHALGFYHMQSSADRDDFVEIKWENILIGRSNNFQKHETSVSYGLPYDYDSVMHYSGKAFSSNGEDTIVPKDPTAKIGQRERMSGLDVKKLNSRYCS